MSKEKTFKIGNTEITEKVIKDPNNEWKTESMIFPQFASWNMVTEALKLKGWESDGDRNEIGTYRILPVKIFSANNQIVVSRHFILN